MTALFPRWGDVNAACPVEVVGTTLPVDLTELPRLTGADLGSVLLAVHARVVATLHGEQRVVVQCARGVARLTVDTGTWRELIDAAAEAGGLAREEAGEDPLTALWSDGAGPGALGAGELIAVEFSQAGEGGRCEVRYRSAEVGAEQARRIAEYHRVALEALLADPDAVHHTSSLVGGDELRMQIHEFAGPAAPLPDERVHDIIARRAAEHPDRIALSCGATALTYRELNRRANQVAWQLLDAGLRQEDAVAVVAARGVEWACAVLGTLKAGAAYLPVEPDFPADRIAGMLDRAGCGLALVGEDAPELPGLPDHAVLRLGREGGPSRDRDPRVPVSGDALAYVYFTSGSTGKPKGAMCEHAGMLNHVLAKIEDLGLAEGSVVAQVAPQCFDISLWQLVSAWVVGGRTVIVEQHAVHDVGAFVDTVRREGVEVLQVVPSYLEVLLEGEQASLPALRCVSVTGEPVKPDLVSRWFERFPAVPVVNAYGLTETSDDTNHAVLTEPPDGRVPVGKPVRNVRIYLVDDRLRPVPLGSVGEIVFAGVCVGRGYINDPERTNRAYLADPYFPGQRMYRSGDFGRWLPDGTLDFLGRRDAQVKIRGFRVELGDVENALTEVPGVGRCAVVVAAGGDGQDLLAGFYTSENGTGPDAVRTGLTATLPPYMVPTLLQAVDELPLTGNGKIDRVRLARVASAVHADSTEPAASDDLTAVERRLRDAWCAVLGVAPSYVRRDSHFFELGGTSLLGIRLSIALGRALTLGDIAAGPVFDDQARLLGRREASSEPADSGGRSA